VPRSPKGTTEGLRSSTRTVGEPYETLKAAILKGDLQPGQQLVEQSLAEWCGVSRTPIREALRRLQQDGLVDRTDRGMAVKQRSPEEILDIYDTRLVLEGFAGRTAADRRTAFDLRTLRRWIERGNQLSESSPGLVEANLGFHAAVWQATHNESLIDLLGRLNLHLARYPETTLAFPGRWDEARREHEELLDAIEARDGDLAQDIATRHFARARDIRLAIFDESLTASFAPHAT
jgi:DNA-binding GntR family transcriptional regulator